MLHAETQLVLRDLVAAVGTEAILAERQRIADGLRTALAPRAASLGLELEDAGVRDVTFPAPLKQVFAQVVEARQAAQAALEKARGETAVLRRLANTARRLDGNPGLVTLRTLEGAAQGPEHDRDGRAVGGVAGARGAGPERSRRPESGQV